jgi:hypothetical protein
MLRPDRKSSGDHTAADGTNKKPRGVSGGANFSFLKEVTANSVAGYRRFCCDWIWILLFL